MSSGRRGAVFLLKSSMFVVSSWQGGLSSWEQNEGEKELAKGNILTKYERQGQKKGNLKDVTILPVANYASCKQSEISRDEPYYYKEIFIRNYSQSISLSFSTSLPLLLHNRGKDRKEQLISRIWESLNIYLIQLPPAEKAGSFDNLHWLRREMSEGSIILLKYHVP